MMNKMKSTFLFLILFVLNTMNVMTQEKTLSLEDLLPGGETYKNFVPKTSYNIQWLDDDLIFSDAESLYAVKPDKPEEKKLLLTKDELNALFNKTDLKPNALSFVRIGEKSYAALSIPADEKTFYLDLDKKEIAFTMPVQKEWENIDFCPENRSLAFTIGNNLYISNSAGERSTVKEDENEHIVYGQSVYRNEFGIRKGAFWSPGGHYLAFYRMDETQVEDYPLVDISAREAKLKNIKYPMAGMTGHEVTVGIYQVDTHEIVYLKTEETNNYYLTNLSWSPDEKFIYIAELNREQNHLQWNKYDVATGKKTLTLFEEHNDKYIEPEQPLLFLKNSLDRFILQSTRDGYNHLYLYDTEGKLIRSLTSGTWNVFEVLGLDKDEKNVFIVANEENPIEFQAYKINLQNKKKTPLTSVAGVHSPRLSASGKYLLDKYSNLNTPLNIDLIPTDKPRSIRLQTAENPYSGYVLPEISLGSLKAADGETDLYYRLVKPLHFDTSKLYPVVIYVYGGPHSQMVKNSWLGGVRGWDIYMASLGYVVFSLDNRGTSNRGLVFEQAIHRHLGITETADQMKGVEFLQSLPYIDKDRMGVHGWSYGGFMTANLLLRHPDVFKVGVAGGPVIDWKYYEVMYGERYMDTPEENPEGYEETNMNKLAGNLKGHFLIIHGDEDSSVVWQHSLSFLKACISARTYPDYFVYPGHEHNMIGCDRVHLHEKITRYFEDYLK
jgi:dipeptidyl-peptidase-4